jgi:hypothetical protein
VPLPTAALRGGNIVSDMDAIVLFVSGGRRRGAVFGGHNGRLTLPRCPSSASRQTRSAGP